MWWRQRANILREFDLFTCNTLSLPMELDSCQNLTHKQNVFYSCWRIHKQTHSGLQIKKHHSQSNAFCFANKKCTCQKNTSCFRNKYSMFYSYKETYFFKYKKISFKYKLKSFKYKKISFKYKLKSFKYKKQFYKYEKMSHDFWHYFHLADPQTNGFRATNNCQ